MTGVKRSMMMAAGSSAVPPPERLYLEDLFSTYLYEGGGATSVVNGIDFDGSFADAIHHTHHTRKRGSSV